MRGTEMRCLEKSADPIIKPGASLSVGAGWAKGPVGPRATGGLARQPYGIVLWF